MNFKLTKSIGLSVLALMLSVAASAQNITVSGVVTDRSGETVIGASVMVQNSPVGTVTDIDGTYSLSVSPSANLEVACLGYTTQVIPVQARTRIDIVLSDDAQTLDAIVVIGYGSARKSDVTGSIASVGGNELRAIPANDISYALQGRVAGVEMTQTSSKPGESMQIRIRGQRSLTASNDPLVVLDGIPFMGSLSDISPNDIKSMDILKDASATAIYGSRGANGVILITTYKGVKGQAPKVSFNSYASLKQAVKYPMMTGQDYVAYKDIAIANGGYGYSVEENKTTSTDWQDLLYQTGYVLNNELSVSGGTERGSYNFGINYFKDQAVVPTQNYDRIGLRGSLDQSINDWLSLGFSTNTNYNTHHGNQVGIYNVLSLSPLISPYQNDGSLRTIAHMISDDSVVLTKETLGLINDRYVNDSYSLGSYNNAYVLLTAPWIEGLSYKVNLGLNYRNSKSGSFTGTGVMSTNALQENTASVSNNETLNWTVENILSFDRTFAGKHHVNAVALYSAEQTTYTQQGVSAKGIPNEQFLYYNLGRAEGTVTVNPDNWNYWQSGLLSWMGRVMYTYDDRYMISAAVRSDASSRLAEGHKWHTYPAVSVGWNIHKEPFMQSASGWLDELKVRAGYGETSNQAINPYSTLGRLATRPYNFGSSFATGYFVSTLPNDELGWEYSKTWNFGVDFSFFRGRLRGTAEYYIQNTNDILLSLGLPATSGVDSYTANIGTTRNKGFELTLNGTIIESGDWRWDAGLNFYVNRNTLTSLASGKDEDTANRWFVGMPINCVYDYVYDGLWQQGDKYMDVLQPGAAPGDIKVKYYGEYAADGTPKRAISDLDMQPISMEADFQGGFNTTLAWKNLDLSVIGSFQHGGLLISGLHSSNSYLNMLSGRRGQLKVDYWTANNTSARYPRPGGLRSNDNPVYGSTLGYFDGSYLKIRTITLGYNFDRIPALRKAGIDRLRIYATVQNPFVFFSPYYKESGIDPEPNTTGTNASTLATTNGMLSRYNVVGYNTPNTHNYLIGINLTF